MTDYLQQEDGSYILQETGDKIILEAMGSSGNSSVYFKDTSGNWQEFTSYEYFKVVKKQNQISEFEIKIYDIRDDEKAYIKEFGEVMFFSESNLILKGRIQKIKYSTAYECTATGYGMESVLLDKELIKSNDKRVQYTNESAQAVAKELLSENTDGNSPWIMDPSATGLFATDWGDVSIRYEYANRLNALAKLSEAIGYEWWVSQGDDYSDYFNIAEYQPTTTRATVSQETFTITGDSANCSMTSKEKDISNLANKVDALGYGDGVNQIHTSTYNASPTYSVLSADITSTDTTIPLADASDFASSGTIRIMEEQITYTGKSGNNLTGCTRGANSTTAYAHKKGVYVEKYVPISSAESGSSIGDNGLMDYTITDRSIMDLETLELAASKILLDRMNPIVRITLIPNEPLETIGSRSIGDLITITDPESGISGDYRIVGMTYVSEYGDLSLEIEASNKSLTFIEQMQKQKEEQENLQKYMQGSTNIYAISEAGNCDANNHLDIRFFIPNEAVAINKVLVNFKIKDYRSAEAIKTSEYYSLSGDSFVQGENRGSGLIYDWQHTGGSYWNLLSGAAPEHGIQLPHGAVIKSVEVGGVASGKTWALKRNGVRGSSGYYSETIASGTVGSEVTSIPSSLATVDNNNFIYYVEISPLGEDENIFGATVKVDLLQRGITTDDITDTTTEYMYENYPQADNYTSVYGNNWKGQSFTVGTVGRNEYFNISKVRFRCAREGSPGIVTCELKECVNIPTGPVLSSGTANANSWSTSSSYPWQEISMSPYTLEPGKKYAWYIRCEGSDSSNRIKLAKMQNTGTYPGGTLVWTDGGASYWYYDSNDDAAFQIIGTRPEASVDLYIGEDGGAMTKKSTYTSDQTEIDITQEIQNIGRGKWADIQFRANRNMRIEANVYVQIFIESK